ncbi:sigma 54 modulation/S30EA ribosomal C-terminal domain-containing protein, partial [Staphylococcus pettenkoferi]
MMGCKELSVKGMEGEEGVLEMNVLGQDLFVFRDRESEGSRMVYKGKNG